MKSALYLCLMVGLGSVALSHYHKNGHENKRDLTNVSHATLYSTILNFGIEIYKQCASTSPGKNVFLSPIDIAATLAMLSLGARSVTRTQIIEGLGFNLTEISEKDIHERFRSLLHSLSHATDHIQVDLGQALFLKDNLNPLPKFLHDVKEFYGAEVSTVNFQEPSKAEKLINDYVEEKTHGKITQLVKSLDPETAMVIVNYIFFEGNWKKAFKPTLREEDFFVNNETIVKVPMMSRLGSFHYYLDEEHSCTVVQIDCNSSATVLFILPDEGKFKQVEDALSADTVTKWLKHTLLGTLDVHLPRFTISTTHELKEPLTRLGIDIFSDQTDLSGITGARDLKVSKVIHKAVLAVSEQRPEAVSATMEYLHRSELPVIQLNRPFILIIVQNNSILFTGSIRNPAES